MTHTWNIPAPKKARKLKRKKAIRGLNSASKAVLLLLLQLASPNWIDGMTIPEIREFCKCSRRQAYRHLDALKDCGIPVVSVGGAPGTPNRHRLSDVNVTAWAVAS